MLTTDKQIFLARSPEFQRILKEDPVLIELGRTHIDRGEELLSLVEMFRGTLRIGSVTVQPITPALWSLLWCVGNRYTTDIQKVDELDTDVFMYLLALGVRRLDIEWELLPVKASGFCKAHGIDILVAVQEIVQMINLAFRPLEMLPYTVATEDPDGRRFDAEWLSQLTATVARETNETAREVMFDMPLSTCYYYYVNAMRRNDIKGLIRRPSSVEVNQAILARVDELGEQFCKEHMPSCQPSEK